MRRVRASLVVFTVALVLVAVFAASALAYPGVKSWSEQQTDPGLTLRTIYGSCQVFLYELPTNVTHKGYIHAELKYKPGDFDCYIYLINEAGQICDWTESQGYQGTWAAKEVVDFLVTKVTHTELNEYGTDMVGDKYYVMVQAFDDVSEFQISGYYPRVDLEAGSGTTNEDNWYRDYFRYPESAKAWQLIWGAPYGTPYDFTPTSEGSAWMQLRYPWSADTKLPGAAYLDGTAMKANFDQYLYPSDWSEDGAIWDYDWKGSSHWLETGVHENPDIPLTVVTDEGNGWDRALSYQFTVQAGTAKAPRKMLHYIPCLWMVSDDPALGRADLRTGLSTIGYRASLVYPQNLRIASSQSSVRRGATTTIKGTLAINPKWAGLVGDDAIAWAPEGTKVRIERRSVGGAWKAYTTATVRANGKWTARFAVTKTYEYRAAWFGSAMSSITVEARKDADDGNGGRVWSDWTRVPLNDFQPFVFADGTVDLKGLVFDPVAGITFGQVWDTATVTASGDAWPDADPLTADNVLNVGDPALGLTMGSDGTKVELKVTSVNKYNERSLRIRINVHD